MVGIVVVSHSRALARAAVTLAEEMLQGRRVAIVIAAGLDEDTFGTDAVQIHRALLEADEGDGVVVLMDLGSAVLSAELALELLDDDEARRRVLLCPAPLVEGLVVAAVTAVSGAGRAEVAAEALAALSAKQSQLTESTADPLTEPETPSPATASESDQPHQARFTVTTANGLHARPAARLVRVLQEHDARAELRNLNTDSPWVTGTSLSRLATLGALHGHELAVRAAGRQAREAVSAVLTLADHNFNERAYETTALSPADQTVQDATRPEAGGALPASPGVGIGPARLSTVQQLAPDQRHPSGSPSTEQRALSDAIGTVRTQLGEVRHRVAEETGAGEAGIFDAQLALLDDPELRSDAQARIVAGQSASAAWTEAAAAAVSGLEALTDPYLRARAADVQAVADLVLRQLVGVGVEAEERSGVLVAADLTPARAAGLDPARVSAVVLAFGSPTAHSAILVRARGIPAVVGAGAEVLTVAEGTLLAVDGSTGELAVDPSDQVLATFQERARSGQARDRQASARAGSAAVTRDGVSVLVGANVGSVEDASAASALGADLIGLVRTEFLFLDRDRAPDVEEQEAAYRAIAGEFPGRRITLRTLDVGGDKPLPYLPHTGETNPFLGVRGLRLALRHPELLADQLLAIARVAHDFPVSMMFPMVSTVDELIRARRMLSTAIAEVGRGEPVGLQVGIMIEVPAAALRAAAFAPHVDFLSVGTNDLTQYALAAERGNNAVAELGDPLDPGVLQLIDATCRGAGPGTTVAVCGELAADETATRLLVGLGVRELSVTPRAVPGVKQAVREVLLADAERLAGQALSAPSATAVRALLADQAG